MAKNRAQIEISAVDKTKGAFRSINKGLKSVTGSLFSMQGAIAAAIGVGGFGALIKSSLSAGDALGKTADKLGTTTEALAGLRHAAELSGVSSKNLDTAMQRLTRRLSETAETGGGSAAKALDALGLSADYLLTLPLDKQMEEISTAMGGMGSQADRVRVAFGLFDTEGVNLVNTLAGGAEGLREAAAEAKAFGTAISRADASKIEAANDAFYRVQQAISGISLKLTAELAPYLKAVADRFSSMAGGAGSWGESIVSAVGTIATAVGFLGNAIQGVKVIFKAVQFAITSGAGVILETLFAIAEGWREIANLIPGVDIAPFEGFATLIEETRLATDGLAAELQTIALMALPSEKIAEEFELIKENAAVNAEELAVVRQTAQEKELSATAKHYSKIVSLDKKKSTSLVKNRKKELTDLQKFNALSWQGQVGQVAGALEAMTRGVTQQSKTMFRINKIAGIANAIINTAQGVTKTLAAYPYPINIGLAAASLAAGVAQVNAIKSTSFGSGGGAPSVAGSGSGSIDPVPTIEAAAPADTFDQAGETGTTETAKTININFEGEGLLSKDQVRDVIEQINEEVGDGATLVVA